MVSIRAFAEARLILGPNRSSAIRSATLNGGPAPGGGAVIFDGNPGSVGTVVHAPAALVNDVHKCLRCVGTGGSRGSMPYCSPSPQGCLALLLGNTSLGRGMMVAMIRGSKVAAIIAWPSPVRWMKSKV
jgi:hypothetical protein